MLDYNSRVKSGRRQGSHGDTWRPGLRAAISGNAHDSQAHSRFARHIAVAVLVDVAGLLFLLVGVSLQHVLVGILGLVLMGSGIFLATIRSPARHYCQDRGLR